MHHVMPEAIMNMRKKKKQSSSTGVSMSRKRKVVEVLSVDENGKVQFSNLNLAKKIKKAFLDNLSN